MPRKYIKKGPKFTEEQLNSLLDAINRKEKSYAEVAKELQVTDSCLRKRNIQQQAGITPTGSGRKPVFDREVERELAQCIGTLCKVGFSPNVKKY